MGMAVSVVFAEMLVTVSIVLFLRRRKLDPWAEIQRAEEAAA
jgi:hypothetical protein